jgi:predicted small secreted protein
MKKTLIWIALILFVATFISSCGNRRGDKCPGVGEKINNSNAQIA